jgi:hypothetical protein
METLRFGSSRRHRQRDPHRDDGDEQRGLGIRRSGDWRSLLSIRLILDDTERNQKPFLHLAGSLVCNLALLSKHATGAEIDMPRGRKPTPGPTVPKPDPSFAETLARAATIAKVILGTDLRPKEQVPRIASDPPSIPISSTNTPIWSFQGVSLLACAALFAVFASLGSKPQPDRRALYTGCELRGAIERCDEFTKAVADGWTARYWTHENMPLQGITDAPSTEAQINALAWQDDWLQQKREEEDRASTEEHQKKLYRQEWERRGVKF